MNQEDEETLKAVKQEREATIRKTLRDFFRMTAVNIITDEGMSLSIDQALHVNRQYLIGEAMIEIGKELTENESFLLSM